MRSCLSVRTLSHSLFAFVCQTAGIIRRECGAYEGIRPKRPGGSGCLPQEKKAHTKAFERSEPGGLGVSPRKEGSSKAVRAKRARRVCGFPPGKEGLCEGVRAKRARRVWGSPPGKEGSYYYHLLARERQGNDDQTQTSSHLGYRRSDISLEIRDDPTLYVFRKW